MQPRRIYLKLMGLIMLTGMVMVFLPVFEVLAATTNTVTAEASIRAQNNIALDGDTIRNFPPPMEVWIDEAWAGSNFLEQVEVGKFYGYNAFDTIQPSVVPLVPTGTIYVAAGNYPEDVVINKPLSILGPNEGISPINDTRNPEAIVSSLKFEDGSADGVIVDGFKITGTGSPIYGAIHFNTISNVTLRNNLIDDVGVNGISHYNGAVTDITIVNNKIVNVGTTNQSGISVGYVTNGVIRDNYIEGTTNGGINLSGGSTNVEISGNEIINIPGAGIQISSGNGQVDVFNNIIDHSGVDFDESDKGGIRIYGKGLTDSINVYQNEVTNSKNGVGIKDDTGCDLQFVTVYDNYFDNNEKQIYNGCDETLDASGNWYGTTDPDEITALMSNGVDYTPWLASGTDTSTDPGFQGDFSTLFVDDDSPQAGTETTIQEAINLVTGSTIYVVPGTYVEGSPGDTYALELNVADLTVQSTNGRDETIIDAGGATTGVWVLKNMGEVTIDGFTVQNFTDNGIVQSYTQREGTSFHILNNLITPTDGKMRNGLQVSGANSQVLDNIVYGAPFTDDLASTGIDVINASDVVVSGNLVQGEPDIGINVLNHSANSNNITVEKNTIFNAGNGIRISAGDTSYLVEDILIDDNILENNNKGINVQTVTLNNVTITNNTIKSNYDQIDGVEVQFGTGIRFSEESATATNISITDNSFSDNDTYQLISHAGAAIDIDAILLANTFDKAVPIDGEYVIYTSIQAAINAASPGDTIEVGPGTYVERILIDKPLTLRGATYQTSKYGYTVPSNYVWDDSQESIIIEPTPTLSGNTVDIVNTSNVTFEGFVVQNLEASGNDMSSLVRVSIRHASAASEGIIVRNNVIGPFTNTISQDGAQGRMGLYIATPHYPGDDGFGLLNSSFNDNLIYDAQGNGNNIFIWGAAKSYNSTGNVDMTGTFISHNEILGSHRSGIEIAGGVDNLTISENYIHHNSSENGGESNPELKYGNGIVIIRMGSDKTDPDGFGPNNLTIKDNILSENEKNGIYLGPVISDSTIETNFIMDNGTNGIFIDKNEDYHGGLNPISDKTSNLLIRNNSFATNANYGVLSNNETMLINAYCNWWDVVTSEGVSGSVSDHVNYAPWLAFGTDNSADPGFQGDFLTVWVDNVSPLSGSDGHIQQAVNLLTNATIYMSEGTYLGEITIDKPVHIIGQGASTVIEAPDDIVQTLTPGGSNHPIVLVKETNRVTIENLVVDGLGKGNSNHKFVGVGFYNAGGTVKNLVIENIRHTDFSGAGGGVGFYGVFDDGSRHLVSVENNTVQEFQKNGLTFYSDKTSVELDVIGNTIIGKGATDVIAQNGIQVQGYGIDATIKNNLITGIGYDNTNSQIKWAATSILNFYADATIENNTISGGHVGVYNIDAQAQITNNVFSIEKIGVYAYGIIATDPPEAVPSGLDIVDKSEAGIPGTRDVALNVDIKSNEVNFVGEDTTSTYGIEADAGYSPENLSILVEENFIDRFEYGIVIYQASEYPGIFTQVDVHQNCILNNASYGLWSGDSVTITVDATENFWGKPSGPYHSTINPDGLGGEVSDNVDFNDWLTLCRFHEFQLYMPIIFQSID